MEPTWSAETENNVIGFNLTEFNKCENKFQTNYRIFDQNVIYSFIHATYNPLWVSCLLEEGHLSVPIKIDQKDQAGSQVMWIRLYNRFVGSGFDSCKKWLFLSRNQVFNLSLYPLVLYFLAFSCAYVDIVLFVSIYGFLDLIFHFGAFWRFAIESKIFQMERIGVQLSLLGHLQDVWLIFCQGSAHFYGEFIQVRVFRGVFF